MLEAGDDEPVLFIAADDSGTEPACKISIFAEGFIHASPARIARKAKHGGEYPVKPVGIYFFGCRLSHFFYQLFIP